MLSLLDKHLEEKLMTWNIAQKVKNCAAKLASLQSDYNKHQAYKSVKDSFAWEIESEMKLLPSSLQKTFQKAQKLAPAKQTCRLVKEEM